MLAIWALPACRRLLFPLLHAGKKKVPFPRATKEIGDVCTQAIWALHWEVSLSCEPWNLTIYPEYLMV